MPYSYCANKSITLLLSTGRQFGEEKRKNMVTGAGNISDIQSHQQCPNLPDPFVFILSIQRK